MNTRDHYLCALLSSATIERVPNGCFDEESLDLFVDAAILHAERIAIKACERWGHVFAGSQDRPDWCERCGTHRKADPVPPVRLP